jgi:hypothetical protein
MYDVIIVGGGPGAAARYEGPGTSRIGNSVWASPLTFMDFTVREANPAASTVTS